MTPTEKTCLGTDCPMSCKWRNRHPALSIHTWGRREDNGLWACEWYTPDLRPTIIDIGGAWESGEKRLKPLEQRV